MGESSEMTDSMVGAGIHKNQHASRCARRLHFEQRHAATRGSLAFEMRLCEPASAVDNERYIHKVVSRRKRNNRTTYFDAKLGNLFDASQVLVRSTSRSVGHLGAPR